MLAETDASAILWTTEGGEMCTQMDELHAWGSGWGRDAGRAFTSNTKLTRHLEHAKFILKKLRKYGGRETG